MSDRETWRRTFAGGWPERLWFAWATVLLPMADFSLSLADEVGPDWQRGGPGVWAEILIDREVSLVFLPLAVLVVGCCLGLVVRPGPWARSRTVRTVLLLGVVFSLHYAILIALYSSESWWTTVLWIPFVQIFSLLALWGLRQTRRALRRYRAFRWTLLGLFLVGWGLASSRFLLDSDVPPPFAVPAAIGAAPLGLSVAVMLLSMVVAPVWTGFALMRVYRRLGCLHWLDAITKRKEPRSKLGGLSPTTLMVLLAAYLVSWRIAALKAVAVYQSLPESPPDCFLATVAGKGAAGVVGAMPKRGPTGEIWRVTPQLRRFKVFEVVLATLAPRPYWALRRLYNLLGPVLARQICKPFTATLAWFFLKPWELVAMTMVRLVLGPRAEELTARFYPS